MEKVRRRKVRIRGEIHGGQVEDKHWGRGRSEAREEGPRRRRGPNLTSEICATLFDSFINHELMLSES